jgi:hypothetical protein
MKLYEIKENILTLQDMDDDQMQDTVEGLEGDFEDKADNIACLIKSLEYETKAIKDEVKALTDRATQKQHKADKLKDYLYHNMKQLSKDKIETARNKLQIKLNPASLILADDFYNEDYAEVIETVKFDKALIKEDLKAGLEISGARLERKERLEVK